MKEDFFKAQKIRKIESLGAVKIAETKDGDVIFEKESFYYIVRFYDKRMSDVELIQANELLWKAHKPRYVYVKAVVMTPDIDPADVFDEMGESSTGDEVQRGLEG